MNASRFGIALVAAGVAFGLAGVALVAILVWGPQAVPAQYGQIIGILGKALMGAGIISAMVIVFLGLGGPVRKLKAGAGKFFIETEGDE